MRTRRESTGRIAVVLSAAALVAAPAAAADQDVSAQFDQFVVKNITGTGNTPGFDILNVTETQTNNASAEVGSHIIFEDSVPCAQCRVRGVDDSPTMGSQIPVSLEILNSRLGAGSIVPQGTINGVWMVQ